MISKLTQRSVYLINFLKRPLQQSDPEIYNKIVNERDRQVNGVNLIAS